MKTISTTEFKAQCLQLLDMVQSTGEELVISKCGKPVARVIAEKPGKPWLALRGTGRFHGDPTEPAIPTAKSRPTSDRKIRKSRLVSLWKP